MVFYKISSQRKAKAASSSIRRALSDGKLDELHHQRYFIIHYPSQSDHTGHRVGDVSISLTQSWYFMMVVLFQHDQDVARQTVK